jgi:hypothetical protein
MSEPIICDVMKQWRWASRRDLRSMAAEIGTDYSTLDRFERGKGHSAETLSKILRWMLSEQVQPSLPERAEESE